MQNLTSISKNQSSNFRGFIEYVCKSEDLWTDFTCTIDTCSQVYPNQTNPWYNSHTLDHKAIHRLIRWSDNLYRNFKKTGDWTLCDKLLILRKLIKHKTMYANFRHMKLSRENRSPKFLIARHKPVSSATGSS